MAGVCAQTGRPLEGDARIVQSIARLIKTRHDLVMRRHLACALGAVVGVPNNALERFAYAAEVATALTGENGEARFDLTEIRFLSETELPSGSASGARSADGEAFLLIAGTSRETGKPIHLTELVA